jgi:hypothetical protein
MNSNKRENKNNGKLKQLNSDNSVQCIFLTNNNRLGDYKIRIYKPEWLLLRKEIKLKLIRLAVLENKMKSFKQLISSGE